MLTIPFRRSTAASLADAVRKYIDSKYGQHPDMFRHDLEAIDAMRSSAIHVQEPHSSGARKLLAYAAQLVWIGGKFPIDIGTEFTWWPALGDGTKRPLSCDNLKYELLNVLFNLAALFTQLAEGCPRTTTDGLKAAARNMSQAAGVFVHMKEVVLPNLRMSGPPKDMDEPTLESLAKLCLAQCQECFWENAVMGGYKDATISRLAARVSDLYGEAMEAATQSQSISNKWIHTMGAKHHHFAAAAQYRMASVCLENTNYGEEIARLQDALKCIANGLQEMKGAHSDRVIVDGLNNLKRRLEQDLQRAEKDNGLIYLNPVPAKSDLAILDRANMAVAKTPPEVSAPLDHMGDGAALGTLLFAKLVPFAVHTAVSIYEERKNHLVNVDIVQQLEALNSEMRDFLRELGIPGSLQALDMPLGIPNTTNMHAEELRQTDAVASMERSFRELENLRVDNIRQFEEGMALLQTEADEDARFRARYGTDRWTRPKGRNDPAGQALYAKAAEIEGLLSHSADSDGIVRSEFNANFDMLTLLSGPDRGLLDFIPSSRTVDLPDTLNPAIGRLRSGYGSVVRIESRRRKQLQSADDIRRGDDIKPEILKEAGRLERTRPNVEVRAADFEDFLNQRLDKMYDELLDGVDKEKAEQEKIVNEIRLANREFESQRRNMGSNMGGRKRQDAIQQLENAFGAYKQVQGNLGAARKFYNDLLKVTGNGFVAHIRPWVDARRAEARELEEDLNLPVLSRLSIDPRNNTPQHDEARYMATQPPQTQSMLGSNHFQQHAHTPLHTPRGQQSLASTPNPTPQGMPPPPAQAQPQPQSHSAAQAHIQSWVGGLPTPSPQPVQFTQQGQAPGQAANSTAAMWTPHMGIRFAAPAPRSGQEQQQQQQQQQTGSGNAQQAHVQTWDPSGGLRFA